MIEEVKKKRVFSIFNGCTVQVENKDAERTHTSIYGNGDFPYNIARLYESEDHIKYFSSIVSPFNNLKSIDDGIKYTIGLEIETCAGYVPEVKCKKYGLIPLRDGSINGIEYATIPLSGDKKLAILKKQLEVLKAYTITDKNCSVHMHFSGFPVEPEFLLLFNNFWSYFQNAIYYMIPKYSFRTANFKSNGKDYCKKLEPFETFDAMYEFYVGAKYYGDLSQPHPNDVEKRAKWNIPTRYYCINFINSLCYDKAKTIEFRFLTPTFSFEKLKMFIYIFSATLKYVESIYKNSKKEILMDQMYLWTSFDLVRSIVAKEFPNKIGGEILESIAKQEIVISNQNIVGDFCGDRRDLEYKMFPDGQ